MRILITGASGYIGKRLISLAMSRFHEVVAASRRPVASSSLWLSFELASDEVIVLPKDIDAVVHLAAETSPSDRNNDNFEVLAARSLIAAAQEVGAKFVFVSSQTARLNAPTVYGRTKWRIELEVLAAGGWVVRPGLVYGGAARGLFGTLIRMVQRSPVLPAFFPAPKVQPIHVDDLVEGLLRIVEGGGIPAGVLCLGSLVPVSFTQFLLSISSNRVRCKRLFLPIPVALIKLTVSLMIPSLKSRLGLERLNSLFDLPLMDTASDLKRLGLTLRSLNSGMHPSGDDRRRRLLLEGRALLTYVLKEHPRSTLIRRYARAIEKLRAGSPMNLPVWALKTPATLALLDNRILITMKKTELNWRLYAASALAEASVQGAGRFLGIGKVGGVFVSSITILWAITAEICCRLLRFVCSPYLNIIMQKNGELR